MTHDDAIRPTSPRWQNRGIGDVPHMVCGACCKLRPLKGSKVRFIRGLRTKVCSGCNDVMTRP